MDSMTAQQIRKRTAIRDKKGKGPAAVLQDRTGEYRTGTSFSVSWSRTSEGSREIHSASARRDQTLLSSTVHEERLLALLSAGRCIFRGDDAEKNLRFLKHEVHENWDLVNLSAPNIVGAYLLDKSQKPLCVREIERPVETTDSDIGNVRVYQEERFR